MPLVNVTHKPTAATARQFDGSLDAMLDIINARPKAGISVTLTFDPAGDFTGLELSGGQVGSVRLHTGDWVVFPADTGQQAFAIAGDHAADFWQVT